MSNGLIAYDFVLKPKNVQLELCDNFYDGAYIPKDNKVIVKTLFDIDYPMR